MWPRYMWPNHNLLAETNSSSNAATRYPEERLQNKKKNYTYKLKLQEKLFFKKARILTNLKRPKSPANYHGTSRDCLVLNTK